MNHSPLKPRHKHSEQAETIHRPHFTIPPAHYQETISNIWKNPKVGKDELLFEMTGYFKKRSEAGSLVNRNERHHFVIDGMALSLETGKQVTLAKNLKRSCQPNCRLTYFHGEELYIFVTSNEKIKKDGMVTLPVEPDFWESDNTEDVSTIIRNLGS